MARVIAGEAGGRRLAVPDGRDTRPTSDRAREALFATISSIAGPLAGARVLDLYAGSGAVGLEALSRGAEHVLLVEHSARAVRVIRQNIEALGLPGAVVVADRVERVLVRGPAPAGAQDSRGPTRAQDSRAQHRYHVVFADPPYAMPAPEVARMLTLLLRGAGGAATSPDPPGTPRREGITERGWLTPGALVIVERATRSGSLSWPDGFVPDRARRYGEATFWYGHAAEGRA